MKTIIKLKQKSVYGTDRLYPITHAGTIELLTGKKTIDKADIQAFRTLGIEFEIETPKI